MEAPGLSSDSGRTKPGDSYDTMCQVYDQALVTKVTKVKHMSLIRRQEFICVLSHILMPLLFLQFTS